MCLFIGGAVGGCCVLEWETPSRFGLLRHPPSRSHKIKLYHMNLETLKLTTLTLNPTLINNLTHTIPSTPTQTFPNLNPNPYFLV